MAATALSSMITIITGDSSQLIRQAATTISTLLKQSGTQNILFMSAGGSALKILDGIDSNYFSSRVTFSVIDERYSKNISINNFSQIMQTDFYKKIQKKGAQFIDTQAAAYRSPEELAQVFEQTLRGWRNQNKDGKVIVTLGIGPDGHTSGILPFEEDTQKFNSLFETERWITSYDATGKTPYPLRVTTTLTFLREAVDSAIVYAVGNSKKTAIQGALLPGAISEIPARILTQMKHVNLYTDAPLVRSDLTKGRRR